MNTIDKFKLAAPCGTYCGDCECYKAKDDLVLLEYLVSKGIRRDRLPCSRCRAVKGECPAVEHICETYTCIKEHNVVFCCDCKEFPCSKLNPAADKANGNKYGFRRVFKLCS